MAFSVGSADDDDEDALNAAINTTPLVDVMLVLLIIFLITIPVVTHTIPVRLPKETNQVNKVLPGTVIIAVTRDGDVYWNQTLLSGADDLQAHLRTIAPIDPQPELNVRGDAESRYEPIGRVIFQCQKAGIAKVNFISEPPPHGGV